MTATVLCVNLSGSEGFFVTCALQAHGDAEGAMQGYGGHGPLGRNQRIAGFSLFPPFLHHMFFMVMSLEGSGFPFSQ